MDEQFRALTRPALSDDLPSTLEKNQEQQWQELTRFYESNKLIIERSISLDPKATAEDDKTANSILTVDSWVETANVVLEGLVALGNVHPILGVAIFAFHSVISLDLSRRENDRKVLAVNLQMQTMMCTMFQLRKLSHIHLQEKEREQERAVLQRLVKTIADDIMKCGSDLNYYTDRKLISKLINSKKYERRFADHIQTFVLRRSELQTTISAYTAAGIDAVNFAILKVGQKLDSMDRQLESAIMALFRKLDTPREQDVLKFLTDHGGPKECISKDELLMGLLVKAGESPNASKAATSERQEFISLRKELTTELAENLDEVLANSVSRFEKLLAVQYNNLEHKINDQGLQMQDHNLKLDKLISTSILILEEGKLIKKAVPQNTTVKLKDPELQYIWDRMGLKKSVKAKNFVLTLRDHFLTDRSMPGTPYPYQPLNPVQEPSSLLLAPTPTPESEQLASNQLKPDNDSNDWVFDLIDVVHVQPVVEAMDEDGSGFISVKEANKFALSRPKGLSLLHWIAYWAVGWHINVINYRTKLYSIMLEMHQLLDSVCLANRVFFTYYLNHTFFRRIEGLIRSIKPLPTDSRKEPKISQIAASVAALETEHLLINLKEMSFVVDSPSNVNLIVGSGRAETWILPLLTLILTRHLEIMKLSITRVVHTGEFAAHTQSLGYIFSVFDERMHKLEAIFHQTNRDVEAQFAKHAYGMFFTSFKNTATYPSLNRLLTVKDVEISRPPLDSAPEPKSLDTSILIKGLGPTFEYVELDLKPSEALLQQDPHPIEGEWIGVCIRDDSLDIAYQGAFEFVIGPVVDKAIVGKGATYLGSVNIEGKVETAGAIEESGLAGVIDVSFTIASPDWADIVCNGKFNPEQQTIKGTWFAVTSSQDTTEDRNTDSGVHGVIESEEGDSDSDDDEDILGHFYIAKIASDIFRFRYLLDGPSPDPSWTLARKRWAFAVETVLYQTQSRMGSWRFFKSRISERRKWVEHNSREKLDDELPTTRGFLIDQLIDEFFRLTWCIPPSTARIYEELATYLHPRLVYFLGNEVCDVCGQRLAFTRLLCIICIEEAMDNQIDLCPECMELLTYNREKTFVHHLSHSLIRSSRAILNCELPIIIPKARLLSKRIKVSFKASEDKKNSTKDRDSKALKVSDAKATKEADTEKVFTSRPSLTALICACCGKDVTLPCWACVTCDLDTLICLDCDQRGNRVRPREGFSGVHSIKHPLLRINDSMDINAIEVKASRMEAQLSNIERKINTGLDEGLLALEQKVNKVDTQLEVVKKEVNDISKHLENLAPSMEAVPVSNPGVEANSIPEDSNHPTENHLHINAPSYEARMEERLNALEAKVDAQFGRLLAKMEEVLLVACQDGSLQA